MVLVHFVENLPAPILLFFGEGIILASGSGNIPSPQTHPPTLEEQRFFSLDGLFSMAEPSLYL